MRIAWCTPFGRKSAIGRVGSLVVEELLRRSDVDIWHPETTDPLETSARRFNLTGHSSDAARLKAYDFAVYNIGNHLDNHSRVFEVARKVPGIVVLHDYVLHGFFVEYYLHNPDLREQYVSAVRRWYGPEGLAAVSDLLAGASARILTSPDVLKFPLFEEAVGGAYAVVTHSSFSADLVREVFPGLVRSLPLPYPPKENLGPSSRDSLKVPKGRVLAITVGDANANKRIREVLDVLAHNPALAERLYYVVIGNLSPEYRNGVMQLLGEYRLDKTVRFAGYASDQLLSTYLTHADFCITLRYPTMETGSASAIEQLFYGKPLIVSDTGFYRELPDDCTLKVRIEHEPEDLKCALREMIDNSARRAQMGERARAFARKTFRADRYAQDILELGGELLDAKPLFAVTDRIGGELSKMGVRSDSPIVSTVAAVSSNLFGE